MIKIDKAYFDKITRKDMSFSSRLQKLSVNEGIIIGTKEWTNKTPPSNLCTWLHASTDLKFKTKTLRDNKGWAILRIK